MSGLPKWLRPFYELHGEKLRFVVVGVWNTVFSYGLFLLGLAVLRGPLGSLAGSDVRLLSLAGRNFFIVVQWLTWVIAVVQSTATMKYFAFRSAGPLWPQVGRAYFVYLPAQGISTVSLWVAVHLLRLTPELGQFLTICVTTVFSYLGHKYFTFRTPLEATGTIVTDAEASGLDHNA